LAVGEDLSLAQPQIHDSELVQEQEAHKAGEEAEAS
jgi:hypothetical protein